MMAMLKKAAPPFVLSFLMFLIFPSLIPQIRLLAFVPFLTFVLAMGSLPFALWLSFIAGLIVDLYSNSAPFGFFALNYTLTSIASFRYRVFFPTEKVHIFSLYAALYSFVSTALHFFLFAIVEMHIKLHFFSLITDLFLMPILDGVYALAWVFFPMQLYKKLSNPSRVKRMKIAVLALQNKLGRKIARLKRIR